MLLFQIVLSLICVAVTAAIFYHFVLLRNDPNEPPLIKGNIPFLGCAIPFGRDMQSFLLKNQAKYGSIFTLYVGGKRIHIISDPVEGVPVHFRHKNFGFAEFAEMMRKKLFLNTEEEVGDEVMTNELAATLVPALLANEATAELINKMVAHLQPCIDRLVEEIGDEWKEIDLLDWCCNLVFELSNIAIMGKAFPNDAELFHDMLQFEDNFLTTWKWPEFLLKKEQGLSRKLVERMRDVYEAGTDVSEIMRRRIAVQLSVRITLI
jgi:sterol 12-alpha-hydroxylase